MDGVTLSSLVFASSSSGFFTKLFSTSEFMPRAECIGPERQEIIWLHILSDAAIALAYYSIPAALWSFVRRRQDVAFRWMFLLFAAFIFACGTTHVFNIIALWYPMYRLDGIVKAATGGISVVTAVMLWPLLAKAISLPSPAALRQANTTLEREIQERRRAESALSESNARLEARVMERTGRLDESNRRLAAGLAEIEAVYQTAAVGLCQIDQVRRVTRANAEFCRLVGAPASKVIGRLLDEICPSAAPAITEAMRERGDGASPKQITMVRDGEELEWMMAINIVRTPDMGVLGHSVAIKDITQTVKLERQARQSQKMEAVGQLASGVAHDINNTLTAIYGYLSALRAQLEPNHAGESALEKIGLAAEQTARMTKALLTFARPTAAHLDTVEVTPVLAHGLELVKGLMPARIELSVDLTPTKGVYVKADPTQLQQVLLNLAINARDAMPSGGRLRVTSGVSDGTVTFVVADTGVGIPEDLMPKIFDPFFTTKPRGEGTGLGLSIVQGILMAHGGSIDVRSTIGAGSVMTVSLPRTEPPTHFPAAGADPEIVAQTGATIILADDNIHVRELLAMQMRRSGYNVFEARDGSEFLRLAKELGGSVLVYVLDIDMPGKSGTDCLSIRRGAGDRTPAVLISGGKEPEAVPDPHTVILAKPFSGSNLLRSISALIARRANGS